MCGRFTLRASPKDVADLFFVDVQLELLPRFNIAPTQEVLAIRAAVDSRHAGATGREAAKVRLPAAKVVVYIDHQDIYVVGSLFKLGDVFRHRQRVLQELVPFWKLQIVNYVDQQQGNIRLVRSVAVEGIIFIRHRGLSSDTVRL